MKYEVEQKFRVADAGALEARLTAMQAKIHKPSLQVDIYYAHPCRDFSQTDEALRIRREGDQSWITYKGPKLDKTTKTRHEIDLALPSADEEDGFGSLLEALGFTKVREVRKHRRKVELTWQGQEVDAALDEVEGLGTFIELEILTSQDKMEAAKRCLGELARHLELGQSERRSYLELLLDITRA